MSDDSAAQHGFDLSLNLVLMKIWISVRLDVNRNRAGKKVNGGGNVTVGGEGNGDLKKVVITLEERGQVWRESGGLELLVGRKLSGKSRIWKKALMSSVCIIYLS